MSSQLGIINSWCVPQASVSVSALRGSVTCGLTPYREHSEQAVKQRLTGEVLCSTPWWAHAHKIKQEHPDMIA